jgi:sulfite reductase (NADPH) flavoprotein alpha-component
MNPPVLQIPHIPESAPFTPEQRAYLNGFLAGMFSRVPAAGGATATAPAPKPLEPLTILFGSQTGNCEGLAKRIAKEAGKREFAPTVHDMAKYPLAQLPGERAVLLVTSTYGDGEPPDNAKAFWEHISPASAPRLDGVRFSVCAVGDSSYAKFCGFGKDVDSRLEALGAIRAQPRVDCDVEYEEPFIQWLSAALSALAPGEPQAAAASTLPASPSTPETIVFSKKNPFPARLLVNRKLNAGGSAKDVRHFEIALAGSGLDYQVGDALGVVPRNDPALAAEIIAALGATGEEPVSGKDGASVSFREALTGHYEITRIPKPLLEHFAKNSNDETLKKVASPDANGELTKFLWGREIIDLLIAHPTVRFAPVEFIALLRKLQPRLYSISSSPKAHPGEVHLTVGAVRYESFGRQRGGVCSTFLADRADTATQVPVFVHSNNAFRPPPPDKPLIMVGPGTGIAPFRAFLEERRATGATGRNWLFFGDQKSSTDFLYREEIEGYQRDGGLHRLDLAWSRDQAAKVYVQDRMRENAAELYRWLEEGAGFYVCGDASRMAKDVDAALHEVLVVAGGKTADEAASYVKRLKSEKRYLRDVY